jgi:hypothetical protein
VAHTDSPPEAGDFSHLKGEGDRRLDRYLDCRLGDPDGGP